MLTNHIERSNKSCCLCIFCSREIWNSMISIVLFLPPGYRLPRELDENEVRRWYPPKWLLYSNPRGVDKASVKNMMYDIILGDTWSSRNIDRLGIRGCIFISHIIAYFIYDENSYFENLFCRFLQYRAYITAYITEICKIEFQNSYFHHRWNKLLSLCSLSKETIFTEQRQCLLRTS